MVVQAAYRLDMSGDNSIDVGAMTEFVQDFSYDRNCLSKKASRYTFWKLIAGSFFHLYLTFTVNVTDFSPDAL